MTNNTREQRLFKLLDLLWEREPNSDRYWAVFEVWHKELVFP